nr:unnamed protein product [Callosobruchus chinensis]
MYWALGSIQRQRDFISACMSTVKPKYRYTREGSTRRPNNAFYFDFKNQRIRICKKFFRNTLCINDRPIRTVLSKRDLNHPQFYHGSLVITGRANTSGEFIEGGLTVADLHRTYTKLRQEVQQPAGNYVLYHKIFNEEYNISFFTPKKDQCELCVSYQNAGETDKATMKANFEKHLRQKELSRIENKRTKNLTTLCCVRSSSSVLLCPKGHTSSFFYVSNLNVFNFTVYDIKTNSVVCYVWNEAQGHRGANEIGTCVLNYLNVLNDSFANETDVIFYSDNCAGQQKNKFMLSMYAYANEGDNAHSLIERSVKRHLKSGPICIPEQYITLIRTAKKTGNPMIDDKARRSRGKGTGKSCLIKAYKNKIGITESKKKSLLSLFNETTNKKETAIPKCYKDYYLNL